METWQPFCISSQGFGQNAVRDTQRDDLGIEQQTLKGDLAVSRERCINEKLLLHRPRRLHPRPDLLGRLAQAVGGQLVVIDARYLDVDVTAVDQWARDALLVPIATSVGRPETQLDSPVVD